MTLVEVMAAVLIVSMFMLALGAVVQSTVEGIGRVDDAARGEEIAGGLRRIITEDFRFVMARHWYYFSIDNESRGAESGVARILSTKPRFLDAEVVAVSYHLEPSSGHRGEMRLLRKEMLPAGETHRTEVVYDRVLSARVQCLDGDKWVDRWETDAKRRVPNAVRWTLEIAVPSRSADKGYVIRKFDIVIEIFTESLEEHEP